MTSQFQTKFAEALLDTAHLPPIDVVSQQAGGRARRFAIHRNNVVSGLMKALKSRFPVTEKIVGEEFFAAMTHVYVLERPPHSPLLATYGDDLADFIAAFEPARELAYLADVTRLEAARTRAYHAADATPVDADRFATLDPNTVGDVIVELLPSTEIVRSLHPIVTIWAMNAGERDLAPIENWNGEDALVVRPHLDVEVRLLPSGGAAFLLALADGRPIGEAAAAGLADHPEFDLAHNLAGLIGSHLVRNIVTDPKKSGPRMTRCFRRAGALQIRSGGSRSSLDRRAGRHSLLAARSCRACFPGGRVLAIRPNQGCGLAPQAECGRAFSERVSIAADRSDARRLYVGHRRTSLSCSARYRVPDANIGGGAPFHDGGD